MAAGGKIYTDDLDAGLGNLSMGCGQHNELICLCELQYTSRVYDQCIVSVKMLLMVFDPSIEEPGSSSLGYKDCLIVGSYIFADAKVQCRRNNCPCWKPLPLIVDIGGAGLADAATCASGDEQSKLTRQCGAAHMMKEVRGFHCPFCVYVFTRMASPELTATVSRWRIGCWSP